MKRLLPIACIAALAGCNSEPAVDVRDASPDEVAGKLADAGGSDSFVRPGKWQTSVRLEQISMPGMPPEFAEQMKARMSTTDTSDSCLTEADVKKPKEDFFAGGNRNCTYDHFTMAGGKIDAEMTCKDGAANMKMAIVGTYSGDSYSARSTMTTSAAGASGGMTMTASVDAKRVGECDAG